MPSSDLANCEITLYTCIIAIITYATKNNSYCNTDTSVQALKNKRALRKYICRNEVCGVRDQKGGIRNQNGGIWNHSPWIRDHKQWGRNQPLFYGLARPGEIRLYHFCGIRNQNSSRFCNQGLEIWVHNRISDE